MGDPSKETIRNGVVLPFFTGKTLFSKSAHNIIVKALNALLNSQVERTGVGGVNEHLISDQNSKIKVSNDSGDANSSTGLKAYLFKSMGGDYLVCHTWDGTTEGSTNINIAKPHKLRHSITTETMPGGLTVGYSAFDPSAQTRLADDGGGNTETQQVTPSYCVDDIIYAIECQTFVLSGGGIDLGLMDDDESRAWAAVP